MLALAAVLALALALAPQDLVVGEKHPELRLPTIDGGRTLGLSQFRGKKILLIDFASW